MPRIEAILFDFAGTLFAPEPAAPWVVGAARKIGLELSEGDAERLAERCSAAGLPGGPYPSKVPDDLASSYARRDLDPVAHSAAYVGLLRTATESFPGLAEGIYARVLEPECWVPYIDTRRVIDALIDKGIRIGLVSNVGFDLRPILRHHGFEELAGHCTLSFEQHVIKPDPLIFEAALRSVGSVPSTTLMVGDHPDADGAAAKLGIRTLIWPMSPAGTDHGLDRVLRLLGA